MPVGNSRASTPGIFVPATILVIHTFFPGHLMQDNWENIPQIFSNRHD